MHFRRGLGFLGNITQDAVFPKVVSLSLVLFFILLGDGILSYWVPNLLQDSLHGSSFMMGLVFSFSSVVGLLTDIIFPGLLKNFTVKKLILSAGILGLVFLALLVIGARFPVVWIFLIAMAIWGVYYEFLGFGSQQFIADTIPLKLRTSGWAILGTFKNLSYFLGPILAGILLMNGNYYLAGVVGIFVFIGIIILTVNGKKHDRPISIAISEVNLIRELKHWRELFVHVWPIIIMSLLLGIIDATFWTTGATWGIYVLPAYQLPALFMGFVVTKWGIFEGKKKMALRFMIVSALFLMLLYFKMPTPLYVLAIFMSSMMMAVSYPLIDAVYSDIVARMGKERKHLVGLSSSSTSLAYIVGPIIAGFIAGYVGEKTTFAIVGSITLVTALILYFVIPKKLKLPQIEIHDWEKVTPNQ